MLITYLKFITKSVVIKTVNLSASLKELRIANFFMIAKSAEKNSQDQWMNYKVFKDIWIL